MRRLSRFAVPPAALLLLLAATACSKDEEAKPPPTGAKLCGITMASWWFDATGGNDLTGELTGDGLPLTNPTQSRLSVHTAICTVSSGKKRVGRFLAEVTSADEVLNAAASIAKRPADSRFEVAGGTGMAEAQSNGYISAQAFWTCKSALLNVEVYRPKNDKNRAELTKTLGKRIASVVGCPGPVPKLPD